MSLSVEGDLPPPESWVRDSGVRMLVSKEALPRWSGCGELPDPEKRALTSYVGRYNRSHFEFAHDLVSEKGAEVMLFRDRIALVFGYEAERTTWLGSPNGGTVVQLATRWSNRWLLDRPEVYRKVLAGAVEAHYQREEEGLLFGVDHSEHLLVPAVQEGEAKYDHEKVQRLEASLKRGMYELWSARLACHHGMVDGLYYQLRYVPESRPHFVTRGGVA